MTDKQIIIDGVDVSGCEYFKINRGFNCYKGHNCTDKECYNCYYKQLKRQEQECERLTSTLTEIKEIADSVTDNGSLCINCEVNKNCADCLDEKLRDILQKISECEGNDELTK